MRGAGPQANRASASSRLLLPGDLKLPQEVRTATGAQTRMLLAPGPKYAVAVPAAVCSVARVVILDVRR